MAFQKYQSEQVQQLAPGFVEAYGNAGRSIGQGLQALGSGIAGGITGRDARLKEEAKLKGSLAPYLAKDKAKVEAGVKFGSLIKNPDGTVAINPESPNKDMFDTSAIDFYNQTGGDINKMEGSDLTKFAASFESKKKIEAMEREAETNQVELAYKRAQTQKLLTDAKLAEWEMGATSNALGGMGFGNNSYSGGGSTIPTVQGSPIAPGAVVTPNLSAYNGAGAKFDTNGLPSIEGIIGSNADFRAKLTRGSAQMAADAAAQPVQAAADAKATDAKVAATPVSKRSEMELLRLIAKAGDAEPVDPMPKHPGEGASPEQIAQWEKASSEWKSKFGDTHRMTGSPKSTREVELDYNAKFPEDKPAEAALSPGLTAGTTVAAAVAAAPKDSVSPTAVSSALTSGTTPTAAPAAGATATSAVAQTPVTSGQFVQSTSTDASPAPVADVAAIAADVQDKVSKLTLKRAAISKERDEKINAVQITADAARKNTVIPASKTALAGAFSSYWADQVETVRKHYDRQIADVDSSISNEQSRLTTAKAAAGAVKAKAEEGRAVAAEGRAVAAAETAKTTAARNKVEQGREDLKIYPQYGPFVHSGYEINMKGENPADYGIGGLEDAQARNEVRTLSSGWIKSTNFIIRMDDTLAQRDELGQDYAARMRLFTKDLNNWAQGELQQIFGVATFRSMIVSGGNFSDSDRIFVQRAIAYVNSLDPINDKDVYKAQIDALAGFIDNMYREGLSAYDMSFSPEALESKAADLEKAGKKQPAALLRQQAEGAKRFASRFNIDYKGENTVNADAIAAARAVLWNALPEKSRKDIDDSAPKSK